MANYSTPTARKHETSVSDIVERLRDQRSNCEELLLEAADLIERQAAEIERLQTAVNSGASYYLGQLEKAEAEIERLRKELRLTQSDLQQACNLLGQERGSGKLDELQVLGQQWEND